MGIEEVLLGSRGVELPDPVAQAKAGLSLADLSTQNQIRQYALATQQRQDKARQVLGQVLPALQQAGWTDEAIQTAIRHPLVQQNPEVIQDVLKEADAQRKSQLEAGRTKAQTLKDTTEARAKAFNDIGGAAFAAQKNPDAMALSQVNAMAKFYGVELPPFSGDPQNPQHVSTYLQGLGNASIAAKDQLTAAETGRHNVATEGLTERQRAEQAQHNRAIEATQRGQLGVSQARLGLERENAGKPHWDAASGQFVYAPTAEAPEGRVATPAGFTKPDKALTETQAKATAFANQMSAATGVLAELSDKGFSGTGPVQQAEIAAAGAEGISYVPGSAAIPRYLSSDNAQKYDQAQLQWTEAALRFMTGANAPEPEVRRNMKTYFPVTGDSAAKIEQKAEMRKTMENSIRMAAGSGVKQLPEVKSAGTPKKGSVLTPLGNGEFKYGY